MTGTDIAFFTAVATAIPVFLVAYVIGVQDTIEGFGKGYSASSTKYLQHLRDALTHEDGKMRNLFGALGALAAATVYQVASFILFIIAVGMPAAAEYASLHGLYVGHATSGSKSIALIGGLIAGAIVVMPLVARVLKVYNPFAISIGLMLLLLKADGSGKQSAQEPSDKPE